MENIKTWPSRIYLQSAHELDDDCDRYEDVYQFLEDITWCEGSINDHDIAYIREDIFDELKKENEKLKEQIAHYQNNALERMADNAKELGLDY